ncbi:MAG: hypothetical protein ABIA74_06250 [bacterium]
MNYKKIFTVLIYYLLPYSNNFLLAQTTALVPINKITIEKENPVYEVTMREIIKAENKKEEPITILSSTILSFMIMQMMSDSEGAKIKNEAEFNKKYLQWLESSGNTAMKIYNETKALPEPEKRKLLEAAPTEKGKEVEITEIKETTIEDID